MFRGDFADPSERSGELALMVEAGLAAKMFWPDAQIDPFRKISSQFLGEHRFPNARRPIDGGGPLRRGEDLRSIEAPRLRR